MNQPKLLNCEIMKTQHLQIFLIKQLIEPK